MVAIVLPSVIVNNNAIALYCSGWQMAGCGYHGNLASIFGVHHYLYYFDWKGKEAINALDLAQRVQGFYARTRPKVV